MVNPDLAARKVARARRWLADVETRTSAGPNEFVARVESRDLATFYLFLAVQETIDLAAHWVADAGWDPPDDAGGAFDVLADRGAIPHSLAHELRALVALRNRIAHGYMTVDHARLYSEATAGIATLRSFLARVADLAGSTTEEQDG
jgi:uncharacterized protein YutE (UPF0331/DUF86 family)